MSESGSQLAWLRDPRLAPHALSALPAWVWSADATHVVWANPIGAAIFGTPSPAALAARKFDPGQPAAAQIARLAETLPKGGVPRLERLRGFGAGVGRALTCACSHVTLPDDTAAILVVATERAGPDLPLHERVRRLLAGSDGPIAVFSADGILIEATPAGRTRLGGATSFAALGATGLATNAIETGHTEGETAVGLVSVVRIIADAASILVANFVASRPAQEPTYSASVESVLAESAIVEPPRLEAATPEMPPPEPSAAIEPTDPSPPGEPVPPVPPELPAERRHPLRFVWQMDAERRFTLDSDEFIALIGSRTAAAFGRPWDEITTQHGLDPEGQVARAIATRDTWSGLSVAWPVDDSPERLTVELSGLPVFDRDRVFRGYRGFGVCRDLARLTALAEKRRAASAAPLAAAAAAETPPHEAQTAQGATETAPTAAPAATSLPAAGEERPALATVPTAENVVPFRAPSAAPSLSPVERRAFRELARRLTERLSEAGIEHEARGADESANAARKAEAGSEVQQPPPLGAEPVAAEADRGVGSGRAEEAAGVSETISADERPVLDRFPVGVLVYRLNCLLYANRAFLRWAGYENIETLSEAGGLDSLFIEPGVLAFEKGGEEPFAITSGQGDESPAVGRLFLVPWEGESAFALVAMPIVAHHGTLTDTALALARTEIGELKSILDTATDGVVVLDNEGGILSSNRSAEALFGYESNELVGRAFTELFAPESKRVALDYLDGLLRDGIASVLNGGREVIGHVRQGGLIPLFMTMGRVGDDAGKLCAVFRDITQWKKAEEELTEAKRQAEKASSAKSEFLAKISHEIRTPLNAIIGFSEVMMEERFGPIGNERYRQYLKDIHASGEHLISLINDLLDLSKIEAGKLELAFTSVALNDVTQQCVAIMQPQANRERIIIRTSLSPKLPQIVADTKSVRQIVLNLLSNSIKFTGAGGQVIVSTALSDDGEVVLRVRDTGVGMSEKDITTALEPFRQLATSARWGSGGTGLGLPLTKALAEANHASFCIKSAPNAGTLVEVTFPATRVLAE